MDRMIKDPKTGKFIKHRIPNICRINNCGNKVSGNGLCNKHFLRQQRYGDPNFRMKRANGEGGISTQGYREITVKGVRILEHRHIAGQILNRKLKRTEIVHHVDGNKLNNSLENLSIVNRSAHVNSHPEVLENLALGPFSRRRTNR